MKSDIIRELKARIRAHLRREMTFCDTGPGFAPADLPQIFARFYQGGREASRSGGHSGLGLYIAKTLVEKHGGTITAYTAPAGGACVKITLPAIPAQEGGNL